MDPISLLENRLEALEIQILPTNTSINSKKTQNITTLLLEAQTMITTALNCREAISSILQHMNTINDYLDPYSGSNELEVEAKLQYLLELHPELNYVQKNENLDKLTSFIESEQIKRITELSDEILHLYVGNMTTYEECREVTQAVLKALQQYTGITNSLKMLIAQLETAVSTLENDLEPRTVEEE